MNGDEYASRQIVYRLPGLRPIATTEATSLSAPFSCPFRETWRREWKVESSSEVDEAPDTEMVEASDTPAASLKSKPVRPSKGPEGRTKASRSSKRAKKA